MSLFGKENIYLDYAAATPLSPEAWLAMEKYWSRDFFNPSSIYRGGEKMRQELEEYRSKLARAVHAGERDVIFTSGGTESDNLAILGTFEQARSSVGTPHIIVVEHDHAAILEPAREAQRRGAEVTIVKLDDNNILKAESVLKEIKENTILISLSYANSETGNINPVGKIGRLMREQRAKKNSKFPYLHVDASQCPNYLDVSVEKLNADLVTFDSGKIYGPKGAGALIVRPSADIRPLILGGGQERGLRSGTEAMPLIAGFTMALAEAVKRREEEREKCIVLKKKFIEEVRRRIPSGVINTSSESLPNIVSITLPSKLHEFIAIKLDEKGVAVSVGSSCSANNDEGDKDAIRFSFGKKTSEKDVIKAVRILESAMI